MSKCKFLLRIDSSDRVGLGHVYRSRELVRALTKKGFDPICILENFEAPLDLFKEFKVEVLRPNLTVEQEANQLEEYLIKYNSQYVERKIWQKSSLLSIRF